MGWSSHWWYWVYLSPETATFLIYIFTFHHPRLIWVTGPIHGQTNLRKLQSLCKCHNENMSKAACLAIIFAYVTEEETIYRKRKRSIWTKDWLKRRSIFRHGNVIKELELFLSFDYKNCLRMCLSTFSELLDLITVLESMMNWCCGTPARKHVHTRFQSVAQPDCCATKFKPVWKLSNCCTNNQTTPHMISLRNSLCCANCLTVYGDLKTSPCK